jgi:hypothetical protein
VGRVSAPEPTGGRCATTERTGAVTARTVEPSTRAPSTRALAS